MTIARARTYALDYATLEEGTRIPKTRLIALLGIQPSSPVWSLRVSNLITEIERQRPDLVCRCDMQEVAILTDAEKVPYLASRLAAGARTVCKASEYLTQRVDTAALSPGQKLVTESLRRTAGAIAAAADREIKSNEHMDALLATLRPRLK